MVSIGSAKRLRMGLPGGVTKCSSSSSSSTSDGDKVPMDSWPSRPTRVAGVAISYSTLVTPDCSGDEDVEVSIGVGDGTGERRLPGVQIIEARNGLTWGYQ